MPRRVTQRGLLREVAQGIAYYREDIDNDISEVVCPYCLETAPALPGAYRAIPHKPSCLVSRARGVLERSGGRSLDSGQ